MADSTLHLFEICTVVQCLSDEGRACRVGGEAAGKSDLSGILLNDTIDADRVKGTAQVRGLPALPHWAEEGTIEILAMPRGVEIITDALGGLRMDGESVILAALADEVERGVTGVDVEVFD